MRRSEAFSRHRTARKSDPPGQIAYLRDTLLVLPPVEGGPRDLARVLALQEQRLGLAVLEAEDLAVTTDVELALCLPSALFCACRCVSAGRHSMARGPAVSQSPMPCASCSCGAWDFDMGWGGQLARARGGTHLARVDLLAGEGVVVGTHVGGVGGYLGLVGVRRRLDVRQFALGRACRGRSDALLAEC